MSHVSSNRAVWRVSSSDNADVQEHFEVHDVMFDIIHSFLRRAVSPRFEELSLGVLMGIAEPGRDSTTIFLRLAVQGHVLPAGRPHGVIQQNEVRFAIKFFRVNAILHQDELHVRNLQGRLLHDFAAQRGFGRLAPLHLTAGDAQRFDHLCVRH